jgi:hypothetical protein
MRAHLLATLTALLALSAACSSVDGPSNSFDEHLKAWREIEPASYEFEYAMQCFCLESGRWWRIQVTNRSFASAVPLDSPASTGQSPRRLTMDSVFAIARAALNDRNGSVGITYDPTWHNPSAIRADPLKNAIDDEWELLVRSERATP